MIFYLLKISGSSILILCNIYMFRATAEMMKYLSAILLPR